MAQRTPRRSGRARAQVDVTRRADKIADLFQPPFLSNFVPVVKGGSEGKGGVL